MKKTGNKKVEKYFISNIWTFNQFQKYFLFTKRSFTKKKVVEIVDWNIEIVFGIEDLLASVLSIFF